MKVDWNKKYTTIAIYAFLVIASSIIVYLMASQAEDLKLKLSGMIATMQPFIIGAAIAYIINFILNFYEKVIFELKYINKLNRKYRRGLGLVLSYFTAIILPSICCITNMIPINHNAFIGDTHNIIIADGIAPKKGPKNGIILVIPITTDIRSVYGILNIVKMIKVNIPIINESKILPLKNLPKVSLLLRANSTILFDLSCEKILKVIFLDKAINFSLSINI